MHYIFVHGLGQNASSWNKTIALMTRPINAACPDLSILLNGQAVTYTNLYHSFSDYCNDISEPFNLCGLSLGGILALNYAIDYPAKVKSLALVGAQYKMPKTALKLQNIIFSLMPGFAFKSMGFKKNDFIKLTDSMLDLDFSDKLKDISCPSLILCGDKDGANKKAAQGLTENITGAKLRFAENSGHMVNTENPEKLATELEAFYRKQQ